MPAFLALAAFWTISENRYFRSADERKTLLRDIKDWRDRVESTLVPKLGEPSIHRDNDIVDLLSEGLPLHRQLRKYDSDSACANLEANIINLRHTTIKLLSGGYNNSEPEIQGDLRKQFRIQLQTIKSDILVMDHKKY